MELKANELSAVVGDNFFQNTEAAYDILLCEVLDFAVTDLMEGFSLDPLGEIFSDHEHINLLAWAVRSLPMISIPYFMNGHGKLMEVSCLGGRCVI